jgi:hypothetical protein
MNSKLPGLTPTAGTQSLESFLKEMEKEARTFKWDALLVFDKGAANTLLTQEYIDRLDVEDLFFPKLPDGKVDAGNGIEHVLLGLVLDKPRLSFENASIAESKAKLQMRMVGGKHLEIVETYIDGNAVRSVQSLALYNAASGSVLDMDIRLEAVAGTVNEAGKVLLDVNKAYTHRFSAGGTESEKIRLGLYFEQLFDVWSNKKKEMLQFPLSEIVIDDGSPINPGVFGIRTHAAPGATVVASEAYGNGAVVVFVAMRGSANGTYPHDDAQMLYMLPDAPDPYTSNLVLSQKFITYQVIKPGLDQYAWLNGRFDIHELPGDRYKLVANADADPVPIVLDFHEHDQGGIGDGEWDYTLSLKVVNVGLFSAADEFVFGGRSLKASWTSRSKVGVLEFKYWGRNGIPRIESLDVDASVAINAIYKFSPVEVGDKPMLRFELDNFEFSASATVDKEWPDSDFGKSAKKNAEKMTDLLKAKLESELRVRAESLMDMKFEIDALRLNNLLFRGENVVEPRDVALPTDLTLLGNLAPKRTSLVINPSEATVASGQVFEFEVEPATGGVTWSVENLPGETGETGEFKDPSVGRYTAPSDDALHAEGYRRLLVTATQGDLVSKSLVSVVPSHVSVNPWVAAVSVGKGYGLSAGTPDSAALKWDEPELGSIAPDNDPLNPQGYKYTAPTTLPKREPNQPHHYRTLRLDPITVRPAAGGAPATIDMLVVGAKNPNYWVEPEARGDGSVALPFYRLNLDLEKVEVPEPVEWTVLKGSGTVDQATRVYTPAAGADDQYVIISAYYVNDMSADTHDYVILPLPFVPVRRYADLLSPTIKEV